MPSAEPGAAARFRREAALALTLVAGWIAPWCMLSAAAWIAGGGPTVGPLRYLDPARIVTDVRGHGFVVWHLVGANDRLSRPVFWLVFGCCIVVVITGAALMAAGGAQRMPWAQAQLRGVSHWASRRELRDLTAWRRPHGRLLIGMRGRRRLVAEAETSMLVIGPTRSGKTTSLIVPNLFEWDGPAVVTSTKSELIDITAAHRQRRGPVYVYDPTGESAGRAESVTWSPLAGCGDLDRAWLVASWLCSALQQGGARGDNDWQHWGESGKLLIAPLLFAAAHAHATIVDVHTWIHGFDLVTPASLIEDILGDAENPAAGDAVRALSMIAAIDQRPERERGTVFSTVMRIFNVFHERAVAHSAMTSRFDAVSFLENRGTLYLCTPLQSPERVASLFVGLLMTVVTAAYQLAEASARGRLDRHLGLFLDELANVVPVEDLPSLASQGAGRGVVLLSIVQDLSQLRTRYGPDRAHSILNNHPCKLVLPGVSDPETVDLMSRLIGRRALTDVQVSRGGDGRVSRSYSVRHDSLAAPDALRQLRPSTAVLLYRGRPPAVVRLRPWFGVRRYRRLARLRYFRGVDQVTVDSTGRPRRHIIGTAIAVFGSADSRR